MAANTPSSSSLSPLSRARSTDDDDPSQSDDRPKKQMRKGTRSCLQCRLRKVACSFQIEPTKICRQCMKRGTPCSEQEYDHVHPSQPLQSHNSTSPKQMTSRIAQLESLMNQILHRLPTASDGKKNSVASISFDLAKAAEMLTDLKTSTIQPSEDILPGISNQAPVMSLFDNSVFSRRELPSPNQSVSTERHKVVLTALRATLPPQHLIDRIIDASAGGWRFIWWTVFPFTDLPPDQIRAPMRQLLSSDNAAVVAKAVVYLALNICHLPADIDTVELGIPGNRSEIMERYIEVVDKLVLSDDLLAASLDGIEAIALQVKYYTNLGRTRRAWLQVRRAIGIAQQCGLVHFMNPSKTQRPIEERRVAKLWGYIIMADLHLSLLLGLSHCVSDQMITSYSEAVDNLPGFMDGERLHARMFPVIKKIIERNQDAAPLSVSHALQLDHELEDLARTQPRAWWAAQSAQEAGIGLEDFFCRRSAQFLFYQVRAVLHMPFMLRQASDRQHQYSVSTALAASRELIRLFGVLKAESALSQMLSRLYDFFTFTAAVTLLLSSISSPHPQSASDSQLVDTAISLLRDASPGPSGRVSAQCAAALELLASTRHPSSGSSMSEKNALSLSIPYFGRIRLAAGKTFRQPSQNAEIPLASEVEPLGAIDLSLPLLDAAPTPQNVAMAKNGSNKCVSSVISLYEFNGEEGSSLPPSFAQTGPASIEDDLFLGFDMPELFDGGSLDARVELPTGDTNVDASWMGEWPQWAVNLGAPMPW